MPAIEAVGKPYRNEKKSYDLLKKIIKTYKHKSVMEHVTLSFDVDGCSRLCLQEWMRHRIASPTVESTRYTLSKGLLKDVVGDEPLNTAIERYFVITSPLQFNSIRAAIEDMLEEQAHGATADQLKYYLPESFRTSFVWTVNARSLENFLQLRLARTAHMEIRHCAYLLYQELHELGIDDLFDIEKQLHEV